MNTEDSYITKDFVIRTTKYDNYGIFFRLPIQRVVYYSEELLVEGMSAEAWLRSAMWKIIPLLLNFVTYENKRKFIFCRNNAAGIVVNEIASPIYFKRKERKMECIIYNDNCDIKKIVSKGHDPYKNPTSGVCKIEKTIISFRTGKKQRIIRNETYLYTYKHVIKRLVRRLIDDDRYEF